eukprot:1162024-Pelagomonas_calceolata.AAC.4
MHTSHAGRLAGAKGCGITGSEGAHVHMCLDQIHRQSGIFAAQQQCSAALLMLLQHTVIDALSSSLLCTES